MRDAQMWVLDAVSAPSAWPMTKGQGATVAVIDSGVNPDVSDLAGSVITGPDLTGVHTPPGNPNWGVHGTWMASLIAGHGHDGGGSGIVGVAPAAKVLSIRVVTDRHDPGYSAYEHESDSRVQDALAQAITYAIKHQVERDQHVAGVRRAQRGGPDRPCRTRWITASSWSPRPATQATRPRSARPARPRTRSPPTTLACSAWPR